MKKSHKVIALILVVLIIDQISKVLVKTSMYYGEEHEIFGLGWALIHFVENEGMAFGIKLGGDYGKLALSLFRIVAVGFLTYYIKLLFKAKASTALLCCFALILAGALGNIIDSAVYGLIFSSSAHGVANVVPIGEGYAGFLYGKVVDMLYFPMVDGRFPEWFPFWGGDTFLFFRPVFNVADMSITVGVFSLLLFHRSFFSGEMEENLKEEMEKEENSETKVADVPSNENGLEDKVVDAEDTQKDLEK